MGIPDDEFTILGRWYEVTTVGTPVHRIDFRQVTPESAPSSHLHPTDGLKAGSRLYQRRIARRLTGILEKQTG